MNASLVSKIIGQFAMGLGGQPTRFLQAALAAEFGFFMILGFFCVMAFLLILGIVDWIRFKRLKLSGIIFIIITLIIAIVYWQYTDSQYQSSKKFWGDYKLKKLDGIACDSCQIAVKKDHEYDIIVRHQVKGHGKWRMASIMEQDIELPYPILKLEHGPDIQEWDTSRVVDYIDRRE